MADGFLEFLIGGWLGARDERRRAARRAATCQAAARQAAAGRDTAHKAAGPRPPSAVERGTVRLLHRVVARDPGAAAIKASAGRRRELLHRARASARRRALRKVRGFAALILIVAGLLLTLAILGRLSEHSATLTTMHRD